MSFMDRNTSCFSIIQAFSSGVDPTSAFRPGKFFRIMVNIAGAIGRKQLITGDYNQKSNHHPYF
jgi:hypothetical protein